MGGKKERENAFTFSMVTSREVFKYDGNFDMSIRLPQAPQNLATATAHIGIEVSIGIQGICFSELFPTADLDTEALAFCRIIFSSLSAIRGCSLGLL